MKYGIIEVIAKMTGQKIWIKYERFNPELHQKINEDVKEVDGALDPNIPVHLQSDPIAYAVATGERRAEVQKQEESTQPKEEVVEVKEEKEENVDTSTLSKEQIGELDWNQLRKLAKQIGLAAHSVSRETLQAQVIDKLFNI